MLSQLTTDLCDHAATAKVQSIAFPAFGTGILQYPADRVAATMVDAFMEFDSKASTANTLRDIRVILYTPDASTCQVSFSTILHSFFPTGLHFATPYKKKVF